MMFSGPSRQGIFSGEEKIDTATGLSMAGQIHGISVMAVPPNRTAIRAQQHDIEIQNLKIQLEEKDKEIADLRQQLQGIQQQNNDLQIKLDTKDEEVNELKKRIQTLEEEKKDLQEDLSRVDNKLKRMEKNMTLITETSKSHEEENRKLKENLRKVEYSLKATETNLRQENEKLKKDVKQLKETQILLTDPLLPALQPSEEGLAKLHLGELCCQIQDLMYKIILPEHYTKLRSCKVKNIKKDVRKLVKDEDNRKKAEDKFDLLKRKLNWNDDFEDAIKTLQETRNIEAHPLLDEGLLRECAEVLENQGLLKGYISLDAVNRLIDIWKQLKTAEQI